MAIRQAILIIVLAFVLCVTSSAVTIVNTFECKTTDNNGTMSHYSYFEEPKLQKNGYTSGYKTGSVNYLFDGNIDFSDKMTYYDGQIEPGYEEGDDTNSSVRHIQKVNFSGKKGISEFYAQGFYTSKRALSAGKKIRFENLTSIKYKPMNEPVTMNFYKNRTVYIGKTVQRSENLTSAADRSGSLSSSEEQILRNYEASRILVDADVGMGPSTRTGSGGDYDFKYEASVDNGVIEIRDATGWTNETGARRIDWDQDAIMRGSFNISNDLYAEGLFFPGAGLDDDWLPCCFDGTHPPIENRKSPGVLAPEKLLPQYSRNRTGGNITINCTPENCKGFECIYTYAGRENASTSVPKRTFPTPEKGMIFASKKIDAINGTPITKEKKLSQDQIKSEIKSNATITYKIDIYHNDKDILMRNITVTDILPSGTEYVEGSSTQKGEQVDLPDFEPVRNRTDGSLTWYFNDPDDTNLTGLKAGFSVFIYLNVTVDSGEAAYANKVKASGVSGNKIYESGEVVTT